MKKLRVDLGYDEILDGWFGHYILDEEGDIFCQVFGKTVEECDKKADYILQLNYL